MTDYLFLTDIGNLLINEYYDPHTIRQLALTCSFLNKKLSDIVTQIRKMTYIKYNTDMFDNIRKYYWACNYLIRSGELNSNGVSCSKRLNWNTLCDVYGKIIYQKDLIMAEKYMNKYAGDFGSTMALNARYNAIRSGDIRILQHVLNMGNFTGNWPLSKYHSMVLNACKSDSVQMFQYVIELVEAHNKAINIHNNDDEFVRELFNQENSYESFQYLLSLPVTNPQLYFSFDWTQFKCNKIRNLDMCHYFLTGVYAGEIRLHRETMRSIALCMWYTDTTDNINSYQVVNIFRVCQLLTTVEISNRHNLACVDQLRTTNISYTVRPSFIKELIMYGQSYGDLDRLISLFKCPLYLLVESTAKIDCDAHLLRNLDYIIEHQYVHIIRYVLVNIVSYRCSDVRNAVRHRMKSMLSIISRSRSVESIRYIFDRNSELKKFFIDDELDSLSEALLGAADQPGPKSTEIFAYIEELAVGHMIYPRIDDEILAVCVRSNNIELIKLLLKSSSKKNWIGSYVDRVPLLSTLANSVNLFNVWTPFDSHTIKQAHQLAVDLGQSEIADVISSLL